MLNFDWAASISPAEAKYFFYALFAIIAVLVLLIPNDYVFLGLKPAERTWCRNLKLWALVALASLTWVYVIF